MDYMGRGVQHHAPHQETSATPATPETPEELVGPHIGVGGFTVPMEVITQTSAIPCLKGSAKTHTGAICIEETLRLHVPALVIDPLRARYGLRWSADGQRPGLPVVVFGGARSRGAQSARSAYRSSAGRSQRPRAGRLLRRRLVSTNKHLLSR